MSKILPDHPKYAPAKKKRDARAAVEVCEAIASGDTLDWIYRIGENQNPVIVAPALTPLESQNALAVGYAKWLSDEMGWPTINEIFQKKAVKRDFTTDGWIRLVHNPEFYGDIRAGQAYVIVDDVMTMGGTLAGLRGFIESQGGRVICMTTLATGDGRHGTIALESATLSGLTGHCAGQLVGACAEELGYGLECLTEAEGRFLLRCPSIDVFREGINGARNG